MYGTQTAKQPNNSVESKGCWTKSFQVWKNHYRKRTIKIYKRKYIFVEVLFDYATILFQKRNFLPASILTIKMIIYKGAAGEKNWISYKNV